MTSYFDVEGAGVQDWQAPTLPLFNIRKACYVRFEGQRSGRCSRPSQPSIRYPARESDVTHASRSWTILDGFVGRRLRKRSTLTGTHKQANSVYHQEGKIGSRGSDVERNLAFEQILSVLYSAANPLPAPSSWCLARIPCL
jgi:hypothetical protein